MKGVIIWLAPYVVMSGAGFVGVHIQNIISEVWTFSAVQGIFMVSKIIGASFSVTDSF